MLAGPLFLAIAVIQMLLRPGFSLDLHPVSALSLGPWGWVQITNFVLTGILVIIAAIAIRARLHGPVGTVWGPAVVALFGVGLVVSGAFLADGAFGFPVGAPAGMPERTSWHSIVHNTAAQGAFAAVLAAALLYSIRFARARRVGIALASAMTPVLVVVVMVAPVPVGFSLRMFVGSVLVFAWLALLCLHTARQPAVGPVNAGSEWRRATGGEKRPGG